MVLPYSNSDYGEDQVGATNIQELTDVELNNLANGELLKYNSTSDKWENSNEISYSAGTGVTINGSNEISIGQSVGTSDSVTFEDATVTGTVVTSEVASTTSIIDVGSGTNRRIRIEDKSSGSNSELEIRPIRTAAGVSSGVQDINSNIQFLAQSGTSDMTLFSQNNMYLFAESMVELKTNSNSYIQVTPTETTCSKPFTAPTVVTPEVASTTSIIDVGSGDNRRIRIEDKSSGNFSELEINPIRTAAGISSNVEPINSYIQFFAQNGSSDMTLFSEDMIQIRTNSNSYIRVTPTEATSTSPFTAPTVTASTKLVSPKLETSGELQLAPNGGTNYMAVSYGSNVLKFSPNWGGTSSMYFYNNGSVHTTTIQGRDFCHLIGDNAGITLQNNLITANQQITAPTLKATDSLIYGGDSQSSPPIGLHIKNTLETNTTDLMRLAPLNTGTARIDPEYNHIKFRTFSNGNKDLLVRGEDRLFLVGGSTVFNDAARITLQQVSSTARVDINGEVVTDSTITCTSLTQTSDARLKRNLAPISDALATIRKLLPQTYEKQGLLDAGFVAQEVETIPELKPYVSTPEDEAPKGLNYSALFTHAVAALQELDTIVQRQASTITALVARISALEGR
jgi:hypothetical protein